MRGQRTRPRAGCSTRDAADPAYFIVTLDRQPFTVTGDHYAYSPASLTVNRNDLVKITFTASDMPHSFTMEGYRISKRANAGQTVTFEFRADQAGTFTYYCALSQDAKCKDMKGSLTVR